jgi:glycosyltransferase involved in cell wall biosynthesis
MRIGFTIIGGNNWMGGHRYLKNLISTLTNNPEFNVTPILFIGDDLSEDQERLICEYPPESIYRDKSFNKMSSLNNYIESIIRGRLPHIECAFRSAKIDVFFEWAKFIGWNARIPILAWIPDLQHRRLPKLFSNLEWIKREIGFRLQARFGRTIMVSSESSKNDFIDLYQFANCRRITITKFATPTITENKIAQREELGKKYSLPENYFYLPNQFWKHKNHITIVESLRILKENGMCPYVICSGPTRDLKGNENYNFIMGMVKKYELNDNLIYLGVVPYTDLLGLMCSSIAVINPSLFEGWSTTVEEAKALGVPLILSDIKVHREQAPSALFFPAEDSQKAALSLSGKNINYKKYIFRNVIPESEKLRIFAKEFSHAAHIAMMNARKKII